MSSAIEPGPGRTASACPVCGRDDTSAFLNIRDQVSLDWFSVHRCQSCATRFIKDPPEPARLGGYYENVMGASMHRPPGPIFRRLRGIRIRGDIAPLTGALSPGDAVIDFGTGDGSVARALRDHGFRAAAADVYPASEWADASIPYRQFDPATTPRHEHFVVDGRTADGMVLRHVLEHVFHPRAFLETAREAGVRVVIVVVPNTDSRLARRLGAHWYYWDPPRHLTFFEPDTLARCAESAGFDVTSMRTYGIDELVTSAFRTSLMKASDATDDRLRNRWSLVARLTRPTGPLAGMSSAATAFVSDGVCHAVLTARA